MESDSALYHAYAGIGSRTTPQEVCELMTALASQLGRRGWTLRSGAAAGADTAFERGAVAVDGEREIYLPWPGFHNRRDGRLLEAAPGAYPLVAQVHPRFPYLNRGSRQLLARNAHQVLGAELDSPCGMVICWTPGASSRGGTGTAIRLARRYAIPVYDLADLEVRAWICSRYGVTAAETAAETAGLPAGETEGATEGETEGRQLGLPF
jgi:hypothetical protein